MLLRDPRNGTMVEVDHRPMIEGEDHTAYLLDGLNAAVAVDHTTGMQVPWSHVSEGLRAKARRRVVAERLAVRLVWDCEGLGEIAPSTQMMEDLAPAIARAKLQGYTEAQIDRAIRTLHHEPTAEEARDLALASSIAVALDEGAKDQHALKAIFLAGSGGSGKSAIGDQAFSGTGLKVVNQDTHLERFLKAANVPLTKAGSRYDLFTKARNLKNMEFKQYARRRLGLVIDSTGWDYDRIARPERILRNLGYDTYMVFVTTSLETALRRNETRGKTGGRSVPPSFIKDAWEGAHKNLGRYRSLFGNRFFIVDNDRDMPQKQFEATVAKQARKIGNHILQQPVQSKVGKAWLAANTTAGPDTTIDTDAGRDDFENAAKPPAPRKHQKSVPKQRPVSSKYAPKPKTKTKTKGNVAPGKPKVVFGAVKPFSKT